MTEPIPRGSGLGAFGILGGTFDPIHLGHLALAEHAQVALGLEQVLFVPNADPPHKQERPLTAAAHRAAMVALAIADRPTFVLDRIELDRPGPSYAVDTVAALAERSRREGRPEPWFVLSAEALEDFHGWREPERVLDLCRVGVARRPGAEPLDPRWAGQEYPGRAHRFAFIGGPELEISATSIRDRLRRGESIAHLVPASVVDYIESQQLYVDPPGTGS